MRINLKGHIGIVEKVKETSSDTGIREPLLCYMNSGCVLECRHTFHTPTLHCVYSMVIHISVPFQRIAIYSDFFAWDSLSLACGEGEHGGMDIGIKLLPCFIIYTQCDVGESLYFRAHLYTVHVHSNGSVLHTSIPACFLCFFNKPYILKNLIEFTCTYTYNLPWWGQKNQ